MFTQISQREGTIDRVPRGQTPVIELDLEPAYFAAAGAPLAKGTADA